MAERLRSWRGFDSPRLLPTEFREQPYGQQVGFNLGDELNAPGFR